MEVFTFVVFVGVSLIRTPKRALTRMGECHQEFVRFLRFPVNRGLPYLRIRTCPKYIHLKSVWSTLLVFVCITGCHQRAHLSETKREEQVSNYLFRLNAGMCPLVQEQARYAPRLKAQALTMQ